MEVSFCELIRETKNAINSRLELLEVLVKNYTSSTKVISLQQPPLQQPPQQPPLQPTTAIDVTERLDNLESTLYRFNDLISNVIEKIKNMENSTSVPPIEVIPTITIEDNITPSVTCVEKEEAEEEAHEEEAEEEAEEAHEEEAEEEAEEAHEEEEEAEEAHEEEEEAEEEGIELEEFEYKGMTLYRDTENHVYSMDEDGALSNPIGIWDEVKQRIKKIV